MVYSRSGYSYGVRNYNRKPSGGYSRQGSRRGVSKYVSRRKYGTQSRSASSMTTALRKAIGVETKSIVTLATGISGGTDDLQVLVGNVPKGILYQTLVAAGNGGNQRIGNRIRATHLDYKIIAYAFDSTSAPVAVHFVLDTQANGTVPTYDQVFQADAGNVISRSSVFTFPNQNNVSRFKFLKSVYLANHLPFPSSATTNYIGPLVSQLTVANAAPNVIPTYGTVKTGTLKLNFDVTYSANNGTIAECTSNALYAIVQGDNSAVNVASISVGTKLRFVDP